MEGGSFNPPLFFWFSLNNSEKVKALTLAFSSIQLHFIRNIRAKFRIPNSPQSLDIEQNSDGCISDFQISGQSLINVNYHNSRASDDIDMKLGTVTKCNKRNKMTSKKLTITSYQEIFFPIHVQFGAIRKLDSRRIGFKTYIFINSIHLSYKI